MEVAVKYCLLKRDVWSLADMYQKFGVLVLTFVLKMDAASSF
jgi:hypothetical protein